ncbi:hypothetical protein [Haliangium ochraceum]|nr:hypothetical protein [Haliangium ochraceum]
MNITPRPSRGRNRAHNQPSAAKLRNPPGGNTRISVSRRPIAPVYDEAAPDAPSQLRAILVTAGRVELTSLRRPRARHYRRNSMDFDERIIITILDKAVFGALLVGLGFWLNKRMELFRSSRSFMNAILEQRRSIDTKLLLARRDRRMAFLQAQLSELYWPLYLRLEKDNTMWKRLEHLRREGEPPRVNALPESAARAMEQGYILPNHHEAVALIEKHAHLIDDSEVLAQMLRYVKHVATFDALRASDEFPETNPSTLGEPFPEELFPLVERKLASLRKEYEQMLHSDPLEMMM